MFFGKSKINSFEKGVSKEWILSDGKGGFAATTLIEVPTKKFHGLFLKDKDPILIKFEEKVKIGKKECFISTNRYAGVVYPDGYRYITGVEFDSYPTYIYSINEALFRKRILFWEKKLLINYQILCCTESIIFEISPLLPKISEEIPPQHLVELGTIVDVGRDKLMIRASSGEYKSRLRIYENVEYLEDGSKETFWSPGYFLVHLNEGESVTIEILTQANITDLNFDRVCGLKERLHKNLLDNLPYKDPALSLLVKVGDTLLSDRNDLKNILSGYPSRKERARETFVSLPGLLLSTGRVDEAKLCFLRWIDYFVDEGLPCEIEKEKPIYKGYESTLWFAYALTKFLAYTNDLEFIRGILPKLRNFVEFLIENKKVDNDGLLLEEDPSNNWMGLKINDEYVVERQGKLIELNALWYNMLFLMSKVSDALNIKHQYETLLDKIRKNFILTFWIEEEGYFKDTDEKKELRPNQIFGMSLPFSVVPKDLGRLALNNIWRHLYTTYGLRTLAPLDKKYKGKEEGHEVQKFKARFRGMAWPWLLGHFFTALRTYFPEKTEFLELMWMPFIAHLEEGCIGGIAEVFDGSMPYEPHGDIIYAPSQGEIIRSLIEDVKGVRPPYESLWSDRLI
ncbi:MAG: amylo-alpha-1,6-glucosidase [Synergistetes bacterium]|nr:amylo-alpha-1,6-glucosidase [Synergistota bacterium]MCX8128204.1 amylo-alpha-1,6-glucosidase [Synergistota bacterium]MDW8192651.1 amylo-alpha-1,6-glucosidase [Synergistota bacterium]